MLSDDELGKLDSLSKRTYIDSDGKDSPWLTEEEHSLLSIRYGTLSQEERHIMERHVELTDSFMSEIHFPKCLQHVREWAASHHELLNGNGYPKHLKGEDIPEEVRILTILDIFDSLVAADRPYKKGKSIQEALNILREKAAKGELDEALVDLFEKKQMLGINARRSIKI